MEMDKSMNSVSQKIRKRKAEKEACFSLDELNQDLLERVLSWLPTSSFFRLRSVCKRWRSVSSSAAFRIACSQVPFRDPWFLMVDQNLDQSIIFDTSEGDWKNLSPSIDHRESHSCKPIPVASSGGLVCYRTDAGDLIVSNPVTGVCREFPPLPGLPGESKALHAIAMHSSSPPLSSTEYKIVIVSGEFSSLSYRVFDSRKCIWQDEVMLAQMPLNSSESHSVGIGDETVYFLSKTGDVVATNMQRSPSKQYSSVLTVENGEEIVYFLSHSGTVVACNLAQRTFFEYPRLLPIHFEYSIDVVECNGQMLVVVLSDFLETASLRVWKFSKEDRSWQQVASMPPSMSHEFYGKKVDINCTGSGSLIFICANSTETNSSIIFNMVANQWMELPKRVSRGNAKEFMSAFSFEPRVEAAV